MARSRDRMLETILEEEQKFDQSVATEMKLNNETKHGKCLLLISPFMSLLIVCGIGFAASKNGKVSIVLETADLMDISNNNLTEDFILQANKDMCVTSEHYENCVVQLCPKYGVVECSDEITFLSQHKMSQFIQSACSSYESKTQCRLIMNSSLIFDAKECGLVCKMLL